MNTDLDKTASLETALDIQRAEYDLKKRDIELKENSGAKWWRNSIFLAGLIPSIIAGLIALDVADKENESVKTSGQNELLQVEQEKILEIMKLPKSERMLLLCALHHSDLLTHEVTAAKVRNVISQNPGCTAEGYTAQKEEDATASLASDAAINTEIQNCVKASSVVTASCRAYDKSGFHSSPNDSCPLKLDAADGGFFAQKTVTVLSESYRNLKGDPAIYAVEPVLLDQDSVIRSFSGSIACTNSKGTGRTCEASATIRAISYPEDSCLILSKELENLTPEDRQKILNVQG